MSKIKEAFKNKKAFISFLTAGDPSLLKTEEYILALAESGSDLIEIGIPFSDPNAEGKVIERANERALKAGATIDKIFAMVKRVRKKTVIPLVFLTYLNPVFVYGKEKFFKKCQECSIDGIIIPDLPFEERGEVLEVAGKYGVDLITLIAPTSKKRIRKLAQEAEGFIYLVSSLGVTGVRTEINTDLKAIVAEIREVSTKPIAIGFGIATAKQAKEMAEIADGIIIGSAIVKIIEEDQENVREQLISYGQEIKSSIEE